MPEGRAAFATTRWSLVLAARQKESVASSRALAELCEAYWYPLYAFVRRSGHDVDAAQDLTQAFFAKLLERHDLEVADRERGRFRTFLLTALQNFIRNEWRKGQRKKRGGGVETLSIDLDRGEKSYRLEPTDGVTPEKVYERRWALTVLEHTLAKLKSEYEESGRAEIFAALHDSIAAGHPRLPYSELAKELGKSEGALRTAVSRLRSRYRELLRQEIGETVGGSGEVDAELQALFSAAE